MRHGYYIPSMRQIFGDQELAEEARSLWNEKFASEYTDTPLRHEGISIVVDDVGDKRVLCTRQGGTKTVCYPPCNPYDIPNVVTRVLS